MALWLVPLIFWYQVVSRSDRGRVAPWRDVSKIYQYLPYTDILSLCRCCPVEASGSFSFRPEFPKRVAGKKEEVDEFMMMKKAKKKM